MQLHGDLRGHPSRPGDTDLRTLPAHQRQQLVEVPCLQEDPGYQAFRGEGCRDLIQTVSETTNSIKIRFTRQ